MGTQRKMKRRDFLQFTSGALGIAGISPLYAARFTTTPDSTAAQPEMTRRTLGRTGLEYTPLGFGAMRTSDPAVIRRGMEMGINNLDTARGYMDGENERIVAKALSGIRDKVYITTKIKHGGLRQMRADLEASLQALDTDYIDILLRHSMRQPEDLAREETRQFLEEAKDSGKARFVGFSTHRNMASLLQAAADDGFYDVVLTAFNFKHGKEMTEAVEYATGKGIGVIAMKTQAGGYKENATENINSHQAALKWALSNEQITSAIPSMVTFQQLEENIAVPGTKFGWLDRKTLQYYGDAIDDRLCRFCDTCNGTCPNGVSVSDLNRCVMYADGYRDGDLANRAYLDLGAAGNAEACRDCRECVVRCVHGVNIAVNMKRAAELFA